MGTDKALLEVGGVALAARVAAALRDAGAGEVLAVGGDESGLRALGCFDRMIADRWPGEGPLGGLLTAFGAVEHDSVVVLACDTPDVDADCPRRLAAAGPGHDVAVGVVDGRRQPLTAWWNRATCLPILQAAFDEGERAPRIVLDRLDAIEVELDARHVADLDRPEDLDRYDPGAPDVPGGSSRRR